MKFFTSTILQVLCLIFFYHVALSNPRSGFYLPDSVNEMTLRYRSIKNLIILPVVINDSIKVNLILDTGCRNLVLFGKRFEKLFKLNPDRQIQFSGLGSGKPVHGLLSLSNKVSIQEVLGESIPVVVVGSKNLFGLYHEVHGVIGYDIFLRFEIELDPREQKITFRPANLATPPAGFDQVALRIVDSQPVMNAAVLLQAEKDNHRIYELMIDTGSSLGLLLKTTNINDFKTVLTERKIGIGFNGPITGFGVTSKRLHLDSFDIFDLPTGIIQSPWHNYASIGMQVLKDYVLVLNYCKAYACFKKYDA